MDFQELWDLLLRAVGIALEAVGDGFEIIRPTLHSAAEALTDFLSEAR